jgi:hypothetical protein
MTEAEWLACSHPVTILGHTQRLRSPLRWSTRKARLFACACCRRIWPWLGDANRAAIEAAERVADKLLRVAELAPLCSATRQVALPSEGRNQYLSVWRTSVNPAAHAAKPSAWPEALSTADECAAVAGFYSPNGANQEQEWSQARRTEFAEQCRILRDLLGNRFQPMKAIGSSWQQGGVTVLNLARTIYEERTFDRLPILADALEDAGCADRDMLDHCRGPGPHVRGCWVVDLLLAKS